MTLLCWNCGSSLEDVPRPISRHEHCRNCFEALHCCRLCRHYRADVNSRCHEDRADPPMNKENANFCDFFRPAGGVDSSKRTVRSGAAQSRLDSLFASSADEADESTPAPTATEAGVNPPGDTTVESPADPEAAARARLNSLFSKE